MGIKSSKPKESLTKMQSIHEGNMHYGHRMRMFSRTGYHLTILPNGKVIGINDDNSQYQIMEFTSAGLGEVRIRGVYANLYLCMTRNGNLYGEENPREEGTVFFETFHGNYNAYLSKKYAQLGWYIGMKKSGKPKPADRTSWGQKAIQFLPIRTEP